MPKKTIPHIFNRAHLGLTLFFLSATSLAQTASYHDHNIYHGAGPAFVNTSPQAQAVGDGGVLRAQLIWQVTPGQTKGADLDIHAKLPDGVGPYTVTKFDSVGVLPGTPLKNPPFGNPNTASDGNQQVNWVNRQVVFSNGQSVASLDQDNRTGVANSPSDSLVENIYIKGATAANPNNIPSGTYQFAVHNYNQTKLANPEATYALWITTNGKVGVRSEGHYRGTGQKPGSPGLPVYIGTLSSEGQSSRIYEIDIVNPDHEPHAPGVTVVDAKRRYLNAWHAEQARLAEIRRQAALYHQAMAERTASQNDARINWGGCPPPMVCQTSFLSASSTPLVLNSADSSARLAAFNIKTNLPDAAGYQNPILNSAPQISTNRYADYLQTGLDGISMVSITGYGEVPATLADIGNTAISGARATYNSFKSTGYLAGSFYYHVKGDLAKSAELSSTAEQIHEIAVNQYIDTTASAAGVITPLASGGYYKAGIKAVRAVDDVVDAEKSASKSIPLVRENYNKGVDFEKKVKSEVLEPTQTNIAEQVTVKTSDGTRTRIDYIGIDKDGNFVCTECKSSSAAPLTVNQERAFPIIESQGGIVVGRGKPEIPGGTAIPPTPVNIIRPTDLPK